MEPPVAFDADSVREQKMQVFRSIRPMSVEDVARFTARGQYSPGVIDGKPVPGYRQEPGVDPSSITETYAAVRFQIENWRWAGVPFYIRTGKRLARNLTEIRVHLKPTPQALFASRSSVRRAWHAGHSGQPWNPTKEPSRSSQKQWTSQAAQRFDQIANWAFVDWMLNFREENPEHN